MKVDSTTASAVRCFDSNSWLIATENAQSDGISVLHQTAPGSFKLVTQGSSFEGSAAGLKAEGIPADLADLLADPGNADLMTGLSCPKPAAVKIDGISASAVQCFAGNVWLLGRNDSQSDGITVLQQTAKGVFKMVTQGSDFTDDADALKAKGIPADVVALLVNPGTEDLLTGLDCPKASQVKLDNTVLAWVGCWDGNAWLVGAENSESDGVSVLQQTAPGEYRLVTQGSDFTGSAAALQAKGIPADLAKALASGAALQH